MDRLFLVAIADIDRPPAASVEESPSVAALAIPRNLVGPAEATTNAVSLAATKEPVPSIGDAGFPQSTSNPTASR